MRKNIKAPQTDDELWQFIYDTWGIAFPRKNPVPGHDSVFQFVADAFFERFSLSVLLANRNGGKTFATAMINALDGYFKPMNETASVAAIMSQTKRGYGHFLKFIQNPKIWENVENSIQSHTAWHNGAVTEILTGTIAGVNSPHPNKSNADEVELMKWEVLQEFFSMAKSDRAKNLKARTILTSTRKYIYGSMQRLLDQIEEGEILAKVYTWNIFGVLEYYTLKDIEEYRGIEKTDVDGSKVSLYDLLAPYAEQTDGFYSVEDAASKFSSMTLETWRTQWTNEKPSREGLIYFMFDEVRHTAPTTWHRWNEHFCGQDFGTSNPNVALLIEYDSIEEKYYVLAEDYTRRTAISQATEETYSEWVDDWNVENWICDPRGAGQILEMNRKFNDLGQDEIAEAAPSTRIEDGIELIRGLLMEGRLIIDEDRCPNLRKEMEQLYHYKENTDQPEKTDDHGCFVAGTMIKTLAGEQSIETLEIGDLVYTPYGYEPVLNIKSMGVKLTKDYGAFRATPDHPIITNKGMIPVDALRYGKILTCGSIQSLKQFTFWEYVMCAILTESEEIAEFIIEGILARTSQAESAISIETFGSTSMVQFHRVIKSTTRTDLMTIQSNLWNWLLQPNTQKDITGANMLTIKNILQEYEKLQRNGTAAKMDISGMSSTDMRQHLNSKLSKKLKTAISAIENIFQHSILDLDSAEAPVKPGIDEQLVEVYNLAVPSGQYFANNILVSNCDALRYALEWHMQHGGVDVRFTIENHMYDNLGHGI